MALAPSKVALMKKLLASALLAIGLILNVEAQTTRPGPPFVVDSPGPPFVVDSPGPPSGVNPPGRPTFSVPDAGSTALLLGLGFAALAAVRRKINQG